MKQRFKAPLCMLLALLLLLPPFGSPAHAEGHDHGSMTYIYMGIDGGVGVGAEGFNGTLPSGSYYLFNDVTLPSAMTIGEDQTVTLCLNGHKLDLNGFYIRNYGSLTIEDCCTEIRYACSDPDGDGCCSTVEPYSAGAFVPQEGVDYIYPTGGLITGGLGDFSGIFGGAVFNWAFNAGHPASFTMNSGNIIGNKASHGGGVCCYSADSVNPASFTMNGGMIAGNVGTDQGVIYLNAGCTAVMNGGSVTKNRSEKGGGFYIFGSTFTMNGGSVSGNSATLGGGVATESFAGFNLIGGIVTGNSATYGGGVCVSNAGFNMTGGSVSDNSANCGGGLFVWSGDLNVLGGSFAVAGGDFTGNRAAEGGAVYNRGYCSLWGGSFRQNHADSLAGGIFQNGGLTLGGTVVIRDNDSGTDAPAEDNCCLLGGNTVSLFDGTEIFPAPQDGMKVGVNIRDTDNARVNGIVVAAGGTGYADCFFGDAVCDTVAEDGASLQLITTSAFDLRSGTLLHDTAGYDYSAVPEWKAYSFDGWSLSVDGEKLPESGGSDASAYDAGDFAAGTVYYARWLNEYGNTVVTQTVTIPAVEFPAGSGLSFIGSTLTMDHSTIDVSGTTIPETELACGLIVPGDYIVHLAKDSRNTIIGPDGGLRAIGIFGAMGLTLSGEGSLDVTSGSGKVNNIGIFVIGSDTADGYLPGDITLQTTGTVNVTAVGGEVDTALGIASSVGTITVKYGTVNANAGNTLKYSQGISVWEAGDTGSLYVGEHAVLNAAGGDVSAPEGQSYGINAAQLTIAADARVSAVSGAVSGDAAASPGIDYAVCTLEGGSLSVSGHTPLFLTDKHITATGADIRIYEDFEGTGSGTQLIPDAVTGIAELPESARHAEFILPAVFDDCLGHDCAADSYEKDGIYFRSAEEGEKNYSFAGWFTEPNGTGTEACGDFDPGKLYYAAWKNGWGNYVITEPLDLTDGAEFDAPQFGLRFTQQESAYILCMEGATVDCSGVTDRLLTADNAYINMENATYALALPGGTELQPAENTRNTIIGCSGTKKNTVILSAGTLRVASPGDLRVRSSAAGTEVYGVRVYGDILLHGTGSFDCRLENTAAARWSIGVWAYISAISILNGDVTVVSGPAVENSVALGSWGFTAEDHGTLYVGGKARLTAVGGVVSGAAGESTGVEFYDAGFESCIVTARGGSAAVSRGINCSGCTILSGDVTFIGNGSVFGATSGMMAPKASIQARSTEDAASPAVTALLNQDGLLASDLSTCGYIRVSFTPEVQPGVTALIDRYMVGDTEYRLLTGKTLFSSAAGDLCGVTDYFYSDGYFAQNPETYNVHLASMSAAVSAAAGAADSFWAQQLLGAVGFKALSANEAFLNGSSGLSEAGCLFGNKVLKTADGTAGKTLVAICLRSGRDLEELASVLLWGDSGEASGAAAARDGVISALNAYLATHTELQAAKESGELLFWVTGHSYGGTVANLTAKTLTDSYGAVVFCYTSGSSAAGLGSSTCSGVHNLVNSADFYTVLAPKEYGFVRYGSDHSFDGMSGDEALRQRLSVIDPLGDYRNTFHTAYFDVGLSTLLSGNYSMGSTLKRNGTQLTPAQYLGDLAQSLTAWQGHAADRTNYTSRSFAVSGFDNDNVTLEAALADFFSVFSRLSSSQRALFELAFDGLRADVMTSKGFSLLSYLTSWQSRSYQDKAALISDVWTSLDTKTYSGVSFRALWNSVGEGCYADFKQDFPVLLEAFLDFLSRDYNENYTADNSGSQGLLYLNATLLYNQNFDNHSLLRQNSSGVYLAAAQAEDSFYTDYTELTKSMVGIEIVSPAVRESYMAGEVYDREGLSVQLIYDDGTRATLTDFRCTNGILTADDTVFTVSYCGFTDTQEISVSGCLLLMQQEADGVHWLVSGLGSEAATLTAAQYLNGRLLAVQTQALSEAVQSGVVSFESVPGSEVRLYVTDAENRPFSLPGCAPKRGE